MTDLENYYNKFNEDKRLLSRHGKVEFYLTMESIQRTLSEMKKDKEPLDISILDIGAATGAYTIPLAMEGYKLSAVELVQHNLGRLKQKANRLIEDGYNINVNAYKGDARKLKRFADNTFDVTLLLGPMYHLVDFDDRLLALSEAKRVTKPGGKIFVAYVMNEYAVLIHGFREQHILTDIEHFDENFSIKQDAEGLYYYTRLDEINKLNEALSLERVDILSPDGPANYMRQELNRLSDEEFEKFIEYQRCVCRRPDLLGAGGHILDILKA